eukprot:gb/GFBE01068463.1/.p1 GENE.gb/GFBE01068463.1/~~gb/GFBE01068463.1/.p1  ORF type:complete len:1219 (+),score=314.49 gb/GFBE01068463.1/:1-3657(+)
MALLLDDDVVDDVLDEALNFSNISNSSNVTGAVKKVATYMVVEQHIALCSSCWLALFIIGYCLGSTRKYWSKESLTDSLASAKMLLRSHRSWNLLNAAMMAVAASINGMKQQNIEFDDNWTILILATVIFYTFEGLLNWAALVSAGTDGLTLFSCSYMFPLCFFSPSVLLLSLGDQPSNFSFSFCGFMRVAQIYKDWTKLHGRGRLVASDHMVMASATFLSAVMALGSVVGELETVSDPPNILNGNEPPLGRNAPAHERWTMFASMYFMFINTSKTGIGDVLPRTIAGQVASFVGTAFCVFLILDVMLKLLQGFELGGNSSPSYPNRPGQRHVILVGSPSFQVIKDLLAEIYHEDHADETEDLNTVIMYLPGQRKVIELLSVYLGAAEHVRLQSRVWTVEGSALKPEDLDRVRFKTCHTAFLMPNIYSDDPEREDVGNVMRALTMKRHTPYIRVLSLVMKADSVGAILSVGVPPNDVICYEEVVQGILGKGAEVPGYAALASSLLKTSIDIDPSEIARGDKRWLDDYAAGLNSSIHEVELPNSYLGVPFSQAGVDLAERSSHKAFLIGLTEEALYPSDTTDYMLFPNKYYRIGAAQDRVVKGIIIAKDKKDIKLAPPGRTIKWTHSTFIEAEQQKFQDNNPRLASSKAAVDKEGFVRDYWVEQKDREEYTRAQLAVTAKRRAALGLAQRGKLSRVHIEEYIDDKDPEIFRINYELEALTEDLSSELMQDPLERVLVYKQIKAMREAEEEKDMMEAEALADFDVGESASLKKGMLQLHEYEEALQKKRMPDPILQEEDNLLWGGLSAPQEKPWVIPKALPEEVLLLGDHIILLTLESDLPEAEQPEEDSIATGKRQPLRPGRNFPMRTFLHSIRCQCKKRVVVVVSLRVPVDWATWENEPGLYLVLGEPLSTVTLDRAGFYQAKSIVLYQKDVEKCHDAALVDSKAVFALRLVEALLTDAGKLNKAVLMHMHLEANSVLMTESSEPPKAKGLMEMLEAKNQEGADDDEPHSKLVEAPKPMMLLLQHRFASGVLFSSSLLTSLAANAMYSPCLGSVISEMAKAAFCVVPVPSSWKGLTFGQLYEFMMRKRNLLPMALLRKTTSQDTMEFLDSALESRKLAEPDEKQEVIWDKVAKLAESMRTLLEPEDQKRYEPGGYPFNRYTLVMPLGLNFVCFHDGVLCMQPTSRVTQPKSGTKRQRHDDPVDKKLPGATASKDAPKM